MERINSILLNNKSTPPLITIDEWTAKETIGLGKHQVLIELFGYATIQYLADNEKEIIAPGFNPEYIKLRRDIRIVLEAIERLKENTELLINREDALFTTRSGLRAALSSINSNSSKNVMYLNLTSICNTCIGMIRRANSPFYKQAIATDLIYLLDFIALHLQTVGANSDKYLAQ